MPTLPSPAYARGLVVGKFSPPHHGHQLLLAAAAAQVAKLLVLVYAGPDDPAHPAPQRAAWLRELYRGDELADGLRIGNTPVHIIAFADSYGSLPAAVDDPAYRQSVIDFLLDHDYHPDVVFGEAYGPGLAAHFGAAYVAVGAARIQLRGRELRAALAAASPGQLLPAAAGLHPFVAAQYGAVAPAPVPRLVLLGAESSGKTTLAIALAEALGTAWVPEFGRTLHEQKNAHLAYEDLLYIGRRQLELEDEATPQARGWLVCDTNGATTALYSYYYFHRCDPALQALAAACRRRYARTVVCLPTMPFQQDGWRGPEMLRQFQHGAILLQLDLLGIPYTLVDGSVAERVAQVRAALAA